MLTASISYGAQKTKCNDWLKKSGSEQNFDTKPIVLDPHGPGEPLYYQVVTINENLNDKYHILEPVSSYEPLSFETVSKALEESDKILFLNPNGIVKGIDIQPGESFTINLELSGLTLIAGRDIPGSTGQIGGSGSHDNLAYLFKDNFPFIDLNSVGVAGSIRVNEDGSIDISGYGRTEINWKVAFDVAKLISRILPVKIKVTGDRLSIFNE